MNQLYPVGLGPVQLKRHAYHQRKKPAGGGRAGLCLWLSARALLLATGRKAFGYPRQAPLVGGQRNYLEANGRCGLFGQQSFRS
jgi:hypothetical protein